MNLLYLPIHEVLEFDDLRLFKALGHTAFSTGPFGRPGFASALRGAEHDLGSPEHHDAFVRQPPAFHGGIPILAPAFLDRFDVIVANQDPRFVTHNAAALAGRHVIWRTVGQARRLTERSVWKAGRDLFVVRCSNREAQMPGFLPTDAVVPFAKHPADHGPWAGAGGRILTFFNTIGRGDAIPGDADYAAIVAGFDADLYGPGNDGLSAARGFAPPDLQAALFRRCGAYLYVHSELACYTLNLIEALMSGVPVVAPSARFVARRARDANWHARRYEVPEILAGGAGLLYDSVEEARLQLRAVLDGTIDIAAMSARARARAVALFSADRIAPLWAETLARAVAAPPFRAGGHATVLGLRARHLWQRVRRLPGLPASLPGLTGRVDSQHQAR
ncbi:hypothetical protein PQJ75_13325 [Rhodoplanes sp. TEM]|uniref:Glycosyltransferase n=1 Tax=Rhodoplanes tepidamans TaxID=200616 RepID=A0ABT5J9P6_RHOTP|nr:MULTISPECIES: hypothetical protein [Rhodoplanes]MDC7786329.1 hypothetical protein [Rhodoplanes tepidamans]MDC7984712.1 hypothetical protein [Rhodoplanes sp. TEM]MDQ0354072.1 hypothetical protein [Rhodoplanes tepidamans]